MERITFLQNLKSAFLKDDILHGSNLQQISQREISKKKKNLIVLELFFWNALQLLFQAKDSKAFFTQLCKKFFPSKGSYFVSRYARFLWGITETTRGMK